LDLTLNLAWLLLGVLAVGATFGVSSCKSGSKPWQLAGIILVLAALFPIISATDDVLRVEHYTSEHGGHHSRRSTTGDELIRLYEAMDAPLTVQASRIEFILLFISFVTVVKTAVLTRVAPFAAGRSPPILFLAA
jgi:hypothetical protein